MPAFIHGLLKRTSETQKKRKKTSTIPRILIYEVVYSVADTFYNSEETIIRGRTIYEIYKVGTNRNEELFSSLYIQ